MASLILLADLIYLAAAFLTPVALTYPVLFFPVAMVFARLLIFNKRDKGNVTRLTILMMALSGLLMMVTFAYIFFVLLSDPIIDWDARSIWFFHAKIIALDKFKSGTYLIDPIIGWSHPNYPKLIPVLAAAVANSFGIWNEFLPKLSILFVLAPGALLTLAIICRHFTAGMLIFGSYFFINSKFFNGYLDGLLAMFVALTFYYAVQWVLRQDRRLFVLAVICAGIVLNLKQEGQLALIVLVSNLVMLFALRFLQNHRLIQDVSPRRLIRKHKSSFLLAAASGHLLAAVSLLPWYIRDVSLNAL